MTTEVKDIDPFWCGWKRDPYKHKAMAYARDRIPIPVVNVVSGAERRHFGYLCLVFYREELA